LGKTKPLLQSMENYLMENFCGWLTRTSLILEACRDTFELPKPNLLILNKKSYKGSWSSSAMNEKKKVKKKASILIFNTLLGWRKKVKENNVKQKKVSEIYEWKERWFYRCLVWMKVRIIKVKVKKLWMTWKRPCVLHCGSKIVVLLQFRFRGPLPTPFLTLIFTPWLSYHSNTKHLYFQIQ